MHFGESIKPGQLHPGQLDEYLAMGWYRMRQTIFTVTHGLSDEGDFFQIYWLRFAVPELKPHAAHKRIRKNCAGFEVRLEELVNIGAQYEALYAHYKKGIRFSPASTIAECLFGYDDEGQDSIFRTKCISIFDGGKLIAAGFFDVDQVAAASILHFYHPKYARYSLGKYLILLTLDYMSRSGLSLYYPGYVLQGSPKMNYKLFLGQQQAQYFDVESQTWRYFDPSILEMPEVPKGELYSPDETED